MIDPPSRARTVLATSSHVELGTLSVRDVLGAHLVDPDGKVLMRPGMGPCWERLEVGEPSPELDLVAADITAVAQPDRLRARVRMRGRVELVQALAHPQVQHRLRVMPGAMLAQFVPDRIIVELPGPQVETFRVAAADYAAAEADPLAGWEGIWIHHLDAAHGQTLRELANIQLDLVESDSVRALQADADGLTLRVYQAHGPRDIRVPFPHRVESSCQAVGGFQALVKALVPGGPAPAAGH